MRKLLTLLFITASIYSNAQVICGGSSATLTAGNPQNLGSPSYSLNPGGFSPVNGNQFIVTPPSTTSYTIYTTGTGTSGIVTTSAVVTVTVLPKPQVAPSLTQASCSSTLIGFNIGLTFNPPAPVPSYTILWLSTPGGILSPQQTSVASGVAPGTYEATITAAGGCETIFTFTLDPTPAQAEFTVTPFGVSHSITCTQDTVTMNAIDLNSTYTYTWSSSSSAPVISQSIVLNNTNLGTWTVTGQNPVSNCTKTFTFQLVQNTTPPSSTITPLSQNITCSLSTISTVSMYANPTVNIAHYVTDPVGGTFAANSPTAIYASAGIGTYTHCLVNLENGCQTCKNFTVSSTQGFPTFSLSSPDNFTLGCSTKSIATINIIGAVTNPIAGGPISYTIIGPGTNTAIQTPTLNASPVWTVNTPGTWTVIVLDNTNKCQTRTQRPILQNTAPPNVTSTTSLSILDCDKPSTLLEGFSETPNVSFNWGFVGNPPNVPSFSVIANANFGARTNSLNNTYTLTVTDISSRCINTTVVPIYQNLYEPNVGFSLGSGSLTCANTSIVLTNTSSTSIPPNIPIFNPTGNPVRGDKWFGPSPQLSLSISSTYTAMVPGTYTLIGKDMNNGCTNTATRTIEDFRDFPVLTFINPTKPVPLDCGAAAAQLTVQSVPGNNVTYVWQVPTQASISVQGLPVLAANRVGTYTVTVTNTLNSCVTTETVSVISGSLISDFAIDRETGYAPLTVNFVNNSTSSLGNASITTVWGFGNGIDTTIASTSAPRPIIYKAPGNYSVAMTVRKGECLSTMVKFIDVLIPSKLEVPNVFTPNGDGINDLYFLNVANMAEITFLIFDRWGNLVYELTSTTGNVEWNGRNQLDVDCSEGSYFYVLTAKGGDGEAYDQKGTITLLR